MVMFVIIIAIMSISMGVAVQTAEFQMRREREAELIFRGKQYIEAIRLYKLKYGRYPMQLKEIYEAKPRVIRKQWKDPITDSENWGIIFLGQEGRVPGQRGRQLVGPGGVQSPFDSGGRPIGTHTPSQAGGRQESAQSGSADDSKQDIDPRTGLPRSTLDEVDADRKMGPIVGVHSTSCDEAIKIYEGHTTYCEWKFVYREQQRPGAGGRRGQTPRNVPVGWHPGDRLEQDDQGNQVKVPRDGSEPPDPVATIPRP
jgi:type II secretory pathway pseudopilin PulG